MSTREHIYALESEAKDAMRDCKELMDLAIKSAIDMDTLSYMDEDTLKTFNLMNKTVSRLDTIIDEYVEILKGIDDRQEKIENTLEKIGYKLDSIEINTANNNRGKKE